MQRQGARRLPKHWILAALLQSVQLRGASTLAW